MPIGFQSGAQSKQTDSCHLLLRQPRSSQEGLLCCLSSLVLSFCVCTWAHVCSVKLGGNRKGQQWL